MALLTFMGKAASALIHTVFSIITHFIVLRKNRTILSCANHFLFFFCFQHKKHHDIGKNSGQNIFSIWKMNIQQTLKQ